MSSLEASNAAADASLNTNGMSLPWLTPKYEIFASAKSGSKTLVQRVDVVPRRSTEVIGHRLREQQAGTREPGISEDLRGAEILCGDVLGEVVVEEGRRVEVEGFGDGGWL